MTYLERWTWAGFGVWGLAGVLTAWWVGLGPIRDPTHHGQRPQLKPVVTSMRRTCWEYTAAGQWPLQPCLAMEAEEAHMDCGLGGELQETWHRWHLSWLQPERTGRVAAAGEVGVFEPIRRQFRGQQVRMQRSPPLFLPEIASASGTDLTRANLEVECAEMVLDLGSSGFGKQRPGHSQSNSR